MDDQYAKKACKCVELLFGVCGPEIRAPADARKRPRPA
jgi:hypothetical protein